MLLKPGDTITDIKYNNSIITITVVNNKGIVVQPIQTKPGLFSSQDKQLQLYVGKTIVSVTVRNNHTLIICSNGYYIEIFRGI